MAGEDNSDAVPTGHAEGYVHFTVFFPVASCCVAMVLMMSAAVVAVVEGKGSRSRSRKGWGWGET